MKRILIAIMRIFMWRSVRRDKRSAIAEYINKKLKDKDFKIVKLPPN
jgi:hypothetical protein